MKRSSIQNSRLNVKPIPYNFGVNLNIPIDPRFIISSLDNIDTELPLNLRYNGLIFFVVDATVNDGTVETLEGLLYTFEKDLTKPIPLYDTIIRFIIHQIEISSRDYSNIDVLLKKTYSKEGNIVTVKPLGVTYIWYDGKWQYFSGDYYVNTEDEFNTIPKAFREEGAIVWIGSNSTPTKKIILSDKELSNPIIELTELPTNITENDRYYLINNYLYYAYNGNMFKIGDKIYLRKNITLNPETLNQITHNFNSPYIICIFRIISTNKDVDNFVVPLGFRNLNNNTIELDIKYQITGDLIVMSNCFENYNNNTKY